MDRAALDGVAPFGRVVLLAIAEAAAEGTAPVRSYEVRERCEPQLDALAGDEDVGPAAERIRGR